MKVVVLLALVGAAAALSEWEMQPEVEMHRMAPAPPQHLNLGALEHALGGFLRPLMMMPHHHRHHFMMMQPHHPHMMLMPMHPGMMPMHPHLMILGHGMMPPMHGPMMMPPMHPMMMMHGPMMMPPQHMPLPPIPAPILREAMAEHKPIVIHFVGMPHPMQMHPMHIELIRRRAPETFRALGHETTPIHQIPQGDLQKALAPLGHLLKELPTMLEHSLGGISKIHVPHSFGGLRMPAFLQHMMMPMHPMMMLPPPHVPTADANTQTYETVSFENGKPHGVVKRVEDVNGVKKVFMEKVDGEHSLRDAEQHVQREQAQDEAAREILAKLRHH